jgi:hypothetical protein
MLVFTTSASDVERLIIFFAGTTLVMTTVLLIDSEQDERAKRAQVESATHLARIAELLEQQDASTVAVPAPTRRRPSARIVALILFALVVAHLRR